MGVIQRQGIKGSIVNYFAIAIGFFATIFIYPIDLEAKGLLDFIIGLGVLFIPYAQLGKLAVYYKYYSKYENQKGAFQFWVIKKTLIQFLIFVLVFYLLLDPMADFFATIGLDKNGNFKTYSTLIPVVILFVLTQNFFTMLSITNKRVVVPDLVRNVIQKIYFPLIIIVKHYFDLSIDSFLILFFTYYLLTIPLLFWYNKKNNFFILDTSNKFLINPAEKKELNSYNIFSILNEISTQLSFKLDAIMVGVLVNFTQTGIYGIMFYISSVLSTGTASLLKISNPIISQKMKDGDIEGVSEIYKKSSITLFVFGSAMFLFIWFLLNDILSLTKYSEQLLVGKYVFLYLALAKLFDMLTSVNSFIIVYSKYYKYNLAFVVFLGVSNIVLNFKLIPIYGIEGAAIASLIAMVCFNSMKLLLILIKLKIHPFSINTLKAFGVTFFAFLILSSIPDTKLIENNYVNLILKSGIISFLLIVIFAIPIYFLRVSSDINSIIDKTFSKIKVK